jgi:hypothetical protein
MNIRVSPSSASTTPTNAACNMPIRLPPRLARVDSGKWSSAMYPLEIQ